MTALRQAFAALDGARIPGGCDHCDAEQEPWIDAEGLAEQGPDGRSSILAGASASLPTPAARMHVGAPDPLARSGRGAGYPGQGQLALTLNRLRAALAKCAQDRDPEARRIGAQVAQEAVDALDTLGQRAERSTTTYRRQQERIRRASERLDRQLAARKDSTPTEGTTTE